MGLVAGKVADHVCCALLGLTIGVGCGRPTHVAGDTGGAARDASGGSAPGGSASSATPGAVGELRPKPSCTQPVPTPRCSAGFCRVEPGCFTMGAPKAEWGRAAVATPQVQVTITRPFEISETELTRREWELVARTQPKQHAQHGSGDCLDEACPQGNVSFFDAVEFANRFSAHRGLAPCYLLEDCSGELGNAFVCKSVRTVTPSVYECTGYRLPTEAEWEYAARAGTTTAFHTGDVTRQPDLDCYRDPNLEATGWYCHNSDRRAHPVARKRENALGLFDVSGNVHEWCNDVYKPAGYGAGPLVDPTGMPGTGSDLTIIPGNAFRVTRSGDYLMPAYSSKVDWNGAFADTAYGANVGVRLVRTLHGEQ